MMKRCINIKQVNMAKLFVKFICLIMCISLCGMLSIGANAKGDNKEGLDIQKVLTRSNLRATPSGTGNWVATIPENALVIVLAQPQDGYVLIVYGECKGYIYGGCITKNHDKTFDDYCKQFPDIEVSAINKSFGIDTTTKDKQPATTETKQPATTETKQPAATETKQPTATTKQPEAQDDQNIQKENLAQNPKEDIHETEYFEVKTREEKAITSPEEKVYKGEDGGDYGMDMDADPTILLALATSSAPDPYGNIGVNTKTLAASKMRALPTSESQKLITVPADVTVRVLDDGENGFVHVVYEGQEGYLFSRCVDYEMGAAYVGKSIETKTEAGRNGGNKERKALSQAAVATLITNNSGSEMDNGNTIEKAQEPKLVKVSTQAVAKSDEGKKEAVSKEISARVNMRTLPAADSSKILSLPIGADVEIIGQAGGGYSLVQYNGVRGYVPDDLMVDSVEVNKLGNDAILFECTAYCSCRKCCGNYSPEVTGREPHTATGTIPAEGRTIAVDPTVIHYGTKVYIEGMGTYTAEDCGGGVKGNHIDIYFESHEAAVQFGRRRLYVSVQR